MTISVRSLGLSKPKSYSLPQLQFTEPPTVAYVERIPQIPWPLVESEIFGQRMGPSLALTDPKLASKKLRTDSLLESDEWMIAVPGAPYASRPHRFMPALSNGRIDLAKPTVATWDLKRVEALFQVAYVNALLLETQREKDSSRLAGGPNQPGVAYSCVFGFNNSRYCWGWLEGKAKEGGPSLPVVHPHSMLVSHQETVKIGEIAFETPPGFDPERTENLNKRLNFSLSPNDVSRELSKLLYAELGNLLKPTAGDTQELLDLKAQVVTLLIKSASSNGIGLTLATNPNYTKLSELFKDHSKACALLAKLVSQAMDNISRTVHKCVLGEGFSSEQAEKVLASTSAGQGIPKSKLDGLNKYVPVPSADEVRQRFEDATIGGVSLEALHDILKPAIDERRALGDQVPKDLDARQDLYRMPTGAFAFVETDGKIEFRAAMVGLFGRQPFVEGILNVAMIRGYEDKKRAAILYDKRLMGCRRQIEHTLPYTGEGGLLFGLGLTETGHKIRNWQITFRGKRHGSDSSQPED
jgi:hypothetical protein